MSTFIRNTCNLYPHTNVHTHNVYAHIHTRTYTHTHKHSYTHTHTHKHTHIHMHTHASHTANRLHKYAYIKSTDKIYIINFQF